MTQPLENRVKRGRLRRGTAAASALVVGAAMAITVADSASAASTCKVVYTLQSAWDAGFVANINITNQSTPITSWKLEFDFQDANQKIQNLWGGQHNQSGQHVTVNSMDWNGKLGTGGTADVGFVGAKSGPNPEPTGFKLNGQRCNDTDPQPPTVTITAPAANARFEAPATIPIAATASSDATKVEFYHDGMLLSTDTSAPFNATWTGVPTQSGAYHLQAIAYNAAGLKSDTADVPVFVDPPVSTVPKIVADPTALTVKAGESGTFKVSLSKAPVSDLTVTVGAPAGDTAVTASPTSLPFSSTTFDTQQTVTVKAAANAPADSTHTFTLSGPDLTPVQVVVTVSDGSGPDYTRFNELYQKLKDPANGYFSPEGVPYHSIETLIDEAPDHGHETTSEAFSYWLWLEAEHGQITKDWKPFNNAWTVMEKYIIPSHADQPTNSFYNPSNPATYAAEHPLPSGYPSTLDSSVKPGTDPLADELKSAYGTSDVYGMHWLLDVDNTYGFGHCGDGITKPAYINTFQRGTQESTWETVPQPSCETFKHGGPNGYLDLFIKDSNPAKQWRYTDAPDADARAIQAAYWAHTWATAQGKAADVSSSVANAAKMGDYLRYSFFDKYFKNPGCTSPSCTAGTGKSSSSYLLSWYYAWGGATDVNAGWAWRIGSSSDHFGYQNPMAAYIMSNVSAFAPKSATGKADWQTSLDRQLEFYQWLQSAEGAIAGGATNSWNGAYEAPPAGTPTFHGLSYIAHPVYSDPPSNQWFGFQAWSMERVAELYYATGNAKAKTLLDNWVKWAMDNTSFTATDYQIPSTLEWSGAPAPWNASSPAANTNLHVKIKDFTNDVGVAGSYAKVLTYYAAKSKNTAAQAMAKKLLDGIWAHKDAKGVSVAETRDDYNRFDDTYNPTTGQGLYIPPGWSGKMPNGDVIKPGVSFLDIRSFYKKDPDWPKVQKYLDGGPAPVFNYHRFWAQADVATGLADYARLFPNG